MIALQARKGNLRPFWSTTGLAVALLAGIVVSIAVGEEYFSLMTVIQALGGGGDSHTSFVVRELRFPRAAVAVVVGAALGLAGMVLQSMSRNPLASPDVLGIVTGAGTGAVVDFNAERICHPGFAHWSGYASYVWRANILALAQSFYCGCRAGYRVVDRFVECGHDG